MLNVTVEKVGKDLVLTVKNFETVDHGTTPKGYRRVASTQGNVEVHGVKIGLNVYAPRKG